MSLRSGGGGEPAPDQLAADSGGCAYGFHTDTQRITIIGALAISSSPRRASLCGAPMVRPTTDPALS